MQACSTCGAENSDQARFCQSCASSLPGEVGAEVRKTVTVIFCDVAGSTALGERVDPELLRRIMQQYFAEARAVIERHGGTVEKYIGDAVMAVFGVPRLHEDDPFRAVRAAVELRETVSELADRLEREHGARLNVRIGVNTGDVVAGSVSAGHGFVTGDAVNTAARLEQAAMPGEVLVGETTFKLVRHAVAAEPVEPLALKGKSEPFQAFRVLSVADHGLVVTRRSVGRMVGRKSELAALLDAFNRVAAGRRCELVTVIGMPGIGKTRLVNELVRSLPEGVTVVDGACPPYGDGVTFWPLSEMVRQVASITPGDSPRDARSRIGALLREGDDRGLIAERVAVAIGLGTGASAIEETFWAVRRLMEALAARGPLVVVLDDLQWAEPTFLDLMEYLVGLTAGVPILFVVMARPDLLDSRPDWARAIPNATTITLDVLSESESESLLADLVAGDELSPDAGARIREIAGGNPLFLEQLLATLVDDGLIRLEAGRWEPTTEISTLPVPASIRALLSSRLDRLDSAERALLERASVVGEVFYWGAVAALSPEQARPEIGSHLMALVRRDLIRPERSDLPSEDAFRFRHLLIRDAAYRGMPKATRATLHEGYASWLEEVVGDQRPAWEEIIGFHLEQASRYLTELEPHSESSRAVALSAASHLGAAGKRAVTLTDPVGAVSLLDRAIALLPRNHPNRAWLLPDLVEALSVLEDAHHRIEGVLAEMLESAKVLEDRSLRVWADVERVWALLLRRPREIPLEDVHEVFNRAIAHFDEIGNDRWFSSALQQRGQVEWAVGDVEEALRTYDLALARAKESGDAYVAAWAASETAVLMEYGMTPVPLAIQRTAELLDAAVGSPMAQGELLVELALFQAMAGDAGAARDSVAKGEELHRDLRHPHLRYQFQWTAGQVRRLARDVSGAESDFRSAWEAMAARGDTANRILLAWDLGRLLCELGAYGDAAQIADFARERAAPYDTWAQIVWRGLLAIVEARKGNLEQAETLALAARERVKLTDFLNLRADLAFDLGEILVLAGRDADALGAAEEAIAAYSQKGNAVSGARARALRDQIGARL